MNEFKTLLWDLLIDESEGEILYENLSNIYNWPEINLYDYESENYTSETLDIENCSIIEVNDECLEVVCGGDTQQPHLVKIELINGELVVVSCESHEFLTGYDYDELVNILNS